MNYRIINMQLKESRFDACISSDEYFIKLHILCWPHLVVLGISKQLPSGWPLLPLNDPSNLLHSGQGFLLPNLAAIRDVLAI